jgi:hypothetical protein
MGCKVLLECLQRGEEQPEIAAGSREIVVGRRFQFLDFQLGGAFHILALGLSGGIYRLELGIGFLGGLQFHPESLDLIEEIRAIKVLSFFDSAKLNFPAPLCCAQLR